MVKNNGKTTKKHRKNDKNKQKIAVKLQKMRYRDDQNY